MKGAKVSELVYQVPQLYKNGKDIRPFYPPSSGFALPENGETVYILLIAALLVSCLPCMDHSYIYSHTWLNRCRWSIVKFVEEGPGYIVVTIKLDSECTGALSYKLDPLKMLERVYDHGQASRSATFMGRLSSR